MQVTLDIPEPLAKKFFSATSARQRSSTVAKRLRAELRRRDLTAACHAANRDAKLNRDIADWHSFEEPVVETNEARRQCCEAMIDKERDFEQEVTERTELLDSGSVFSVCSC